MTVHIFAVWLRWVAKKNSTYFPSYMRMCWKLNLFEKSAWQAHGGLRNFTLAQQKKLEFRLLSDIRLNSAQYRKFWSQHISTREERVPLTGLGNPARVIFSRTRSTNRPCNFPPLPCFYFDDKVLNPLLLADKTC